VADGIEGPEKDFEGLIRDKKDPCTKVQGLFDGG